MKQQLDRRGWAMRTLFMDRKEVAEDPRRRVLTRSIVVPRLRVGDRGPSLRAIDGSSP